MGHDFEPLSARIIEAAIAVHKALGPGFLESIYHAALRVALSRSGIPYENKNCVGMRSNRSRKHESTKTRK
jgi:GxxExxY protein